MGEKLGGKICGFFHTLVLQKMWDFNPSQEMEIGVCASARLVVVNISSSGGGVLKKSRWQTQIM